MARRFGFILRKGINKLLVYKKDYKKEAKDLFHTGFWLLLFLFINANLLMLGNCALKVDNSLKTVDNSRITLDKLAKMVDTY
jgi:hypothetical protein